MRLWPIESEQPMDTSHVADTEVQDRYRRIADGFEQRLTTLSPNQQNLPTPCTDWDVATLVAHVISTHRRIGAQAGGPAASDPDPNGELELQWREARALIAEVLGDPIRAQATVGGVFGEQTFESLVSRLLCADTLYHTWDLARASAQDDHLDEDACEKALRFLEPLDEAIRRPGGFAARISPPPGADVQTRFLNFGGRAAD